VEFPSHLLDELARVFAQAALDRLLRDAMAAANPEQDESNRQGPESVPAAASKTPPCES
jgi:hypothetical protein